MEEKSLSVLSFDDKPVVFNIAEEGLRSLESRWVEIPDCSEKEGYKIVKEGISDLVSLRTSVEKCRVEQKRESIDYGKRVDSAAKGIAKRLVAMEARLKDKKAIEDKKKEEAKQEKLRAEKARVDGIQALIEDIRGMAVIAPGFSSETIEHSISVLALIEITEERFAEFVGTAIASRHQAVSILKQHLEHRVAEETAARGLRVEQQRIADEQAVEAERVKAEREKIEAERAELAEKLRIEKAKMDAERAEFAKQKAEQAAEQKERERAAQEKATLEQEKAKREQAEREAAARELQLEKEKKLANERAEQEAKLRIEQREAEERRRVEQSRIDAEHLKIKEQQRIIDEEKQRQDEARKAQEQEETRIAAERLSLELQEERKAEIAEALDCYDNPVDTAESIIRGEIPHVKYTG